jgi:hypothetical protein
MMWRREGALVGYVYDNDQAQPCGLDVATGVTFRANRWYAIRQRVRLNTGTAHNGVLQIWVDGANVLEKTDFAFMNAGPDAKIDVLMFHAFYGGNGQEWAPIRDTTISFADVFVTVNAP